MTRLYFFWKLFRLYRSGGCPLEYALREAWEVSRYA